MSSTKAERLLRWVYLLCFPFCCISYNPDQAIAAVTTSEDGQTVFTISRGQLLRSDDGGFSWQRIMKDMFCFEQSCGGYKGQYLLASPSYDTDKTVFFGSEKYGLRKSIDGGHNWLLVGQDMFRICSGRVGGKGRLSLSPGFGSTDQVLLVVGQSKDPARATSYFLYRSEDGGKSFEKIHFDPAVGGLKECAVLYSVSENIHFLGTESGDLLGSTDGGKSWARVEGLKISSSLIAGKSGGQEEPSNLTLYLMGEKDVAEVDITVTSGGELQVDQTTMLNVPGNSRAFLNMASSQGAESGHTALFLLKSGRDSTVVVSRDNGQRWSLVQAYELIGEPEASDHIINTLGYEEFYDVWIVPGTETVYLGAFQGLFRSDDNAKTWNLLDTVSGWITGLSVGPAADGGYQLGFCTELQGCYGRSYGISSIEYDELAPLLPSSSSDFVNTSSHLDMVVVSPTYDKDGIILRSATGKDQNIKGLLRMSSTDTIDSSWSFVNLPPLDPNEKYVVVHAIDFSPGFDQDKTVFVAGHNIGLTISTDGGESFELLWDPRKNSVNGTVTTVALSPDYETDGTIVVLVDDYAKWGNTNHLSYTADVYISKDNGHMWKKITSRKEPWMNLVVLRGGGNSIVMAIDDRGSIHAYNEAHGTGGNSWRSFDRARRAMTTERNDIVHGHIGTNPSTTSSKIPNRYIANGVMRSPTGNQLLVAFEKGGMERFDNFDATLNHFSKTNFLPAIGEDMIGDPALDMKFGYSRKKNWLNGAGDAIAFSPQYEEDGVIFAASFYSIYVSRDQGVNWKEIFRLPHNNMQDPDVKKAKSTHHILLLIICIVALLLGVWLILRVGKCRRISKAGEREDVNESEQRDDKNGFSDHGNDKIVIGDHEYDEEEFIVVEFKDDVESSKNNQVDLWDDPKDSIEELVDTIVNSAKEEWVDENEIYNVTQDRTRKFLSSLTFNKTTDDAKLHQP